MIKTLPSDHFFSFNGNRTDRSSLQSQSLQKPVGLIRSLSQESPFGNNMARMSNGNPIIKGQNKIEVKIGQKQPGSLFSPRQPLRTYSLNSW